MKTKYNSKLTKIDFIMMAVILIIASSLFIFYKSTQKEAGFVRIKINNKLIREQALDKNDAFEVTDNHGGVNKIVIANSSVKVTEANCSDLVCTYQKPISKSGESIICLPHKLVVEVYSKDDDGLDSISN